MSELDIHNHNFVKYACDTNHICQKLFENTPINFFEPLRVHKDNTYSGFMSHGTWAEHFLNQNYQDIGIHEHQESLANSVIIWKSSGVFDINAQARSLYQDCIDFGFKNGLSLVEKHEDYIQFYYFATGSDTETINPFFTENMETIYQFLFYFNETIQNSKVLSDAYNAKIPRSTNTANIADSKPNLISADFPVKNFFFSQNLVFSSRETECLVLAALGHSSKQIACQLAISARTVETHLNNAKRKSGEHSMPQLLNKLRSLPPFQHLLNKEMNC